MDTCRAGSGPCRAASCLALCNSCPLSGLSLVTLDPGVPSSATTLWLYGEGGGLITKGSFLFFILHCLWPQQNE